MTWFWILYATPVQLVGAVTIAMAFLAWLRGGPWERLGAAIICLALAVSRRIEEPPHAVGPAYELFALDLALFAASAIIALRSRLWWAVSVAGFQLFAVGLHVAMIVEHRAVIYAYYIGLGFSTYLVLLSVIVGTLRRRPLLPLPALSRRLGLIFRREAPRSDTVALLIFGAEAIAIAASFIAPSGYQ